MRIRANLLKNFQNTLIVRIDDAVATSYIQHEDYVVFRNEDKIVGYNIFHFDEEKSGKLEITQQLIDKINQRVNQNLTHDTYSYLVVGKVLSIIPHPNSDKLKICQVDVRSKILQIVCGASNVLENQIVVVALENAIVNDMFIKNGTLLKEKSEGMICSAYELGLIKEKKKGILVLDESYTVGEEFYWKGAQNV